MSGEGYGNREGRSEGMRGAQKREDSEEGRSDGPTAGEEERARKREKEGGERHENQSNS